jgi:hypothetical protein
VTTKLAVWNGSLLAVGHRRLSDTGEAVEAGRELTAVWPQVLAECVSIGSWNFAMETIKAEYDTGVTPEFGYSKVFAKPTDWVRTIGISADENFSLPLLHYYDDMNFWSAEDSPIYIRYVSNDTGLGYDLSRWGAAFTRYVELELATRLCLKLTQSEKLEEKLEQKRDKAKRTALNQDAMNEPQPKFGPPSGWTAARGNGGSRERGSRSNLTG